MGVPSGKVERQQWLARTWSRPLQAVLVMLLIFLPLWWQTGKWYRDRLLGEHRVRVSAELLPYANALASTVHRRLALLEGLAAFTHIEHTDAELDAHFNPFAAKLREGTSGIRALAVGAQGVVRLIHPLAGNEAAVGHDVLHDPRPEVKAAVERMMRTRQIALNGPVELRQGGLGLVGRQPVFEGDTFWGMAAIVLDVLPILQETGIDSTQQEMELAISDGAGKVFHGSAAVLTADPVVYPIDLVDGAWTISAIPTGGWSAAISRGVVHFRGAGLIIIGLLASVVALVANRHANLTELVQQRTQTLVLEVEGHRKAEAALQENEEQLTAVLTASQKAEAELTAQLEIIRQQQEAIRTLSMPILQVWDGVLALPVLGVLDAIRATSMMEALLEAVARTQARHVILDLTGVETIDAPTADHVVKLVAAVGLLGARGIVTGIRPQVARSIAAVQADITRLTTLANMRSALLFCMRPERA
jgi:sensor domain CHASE-containing protein/anti-anti-sigma regulatory factor